MCTGNRWHGMLWNVLERTRQREETGYNAEGHLYRPLREGLLAKKLREWRCSAERGSVGKQTASADPGGVTVLGKL